MSCKKTAERLSEILGFQVKLKVLYLSLHTDHSHYMFILELKRTDMNDGVVIQGYGEHITSDYDVTALCATKSSVYASTGMGAAKRMRPIVHDHLTKTNVADIILAAYADNTVNPGQAWTLIRSLLG